MLDDYFGFNFQLFHIGRNSTLSLTFFKQQSIFNSTNY